MSNVAAAIKRREDARRKPKRKPKDKPVELGEAHKIVEPA